MYKVKHHIIIKWVDNRRNAYVSDYTENTEIVETNPNYTREEYLRDIRDDGCMELYISDEEDILCGEDINDIVEYTKEWISVSLGDKIISSITRIKREKTLKHILK